MYAVEVSRRESGFSLTEVLVALAITTVMLSSVMALSAVRAAPDGVLWLTRGSVLAARRTGQILGESLLGHYRETLAEIRRTGFLAYWAREYKPYLLAAAKQFSPRHRTLTERWLRGSAERRVTD